jgi:N-acetylmuramic acid 6-phosphate (MurNAc-6-P) etherase
MARRGVDAAEARRLLEAANGFVRPVVGDPPAVKQ